MRVDRGDGHAGIEPSQATQVLFLATLFLLPWQWFPPFPWLHEHAQWSDPLAALAALSLALDGLRQRRLPRLGKVHAAAAAYLLFAAFSAAAHGAQAAALSKLLGMAALVALLVLAGEVAGSASGRRAIARTVAASAACVALLAYVGQTGFYLGHETPLLIASYGEHLTPGSGYARARSVLLHPNLLASFCLFASMVIRAAPGALAPGLRRCLLAGIAGAACLAYSRTAFALGVATLLARATHAKQRRLAWVAAGFWALVQVWLAVVNLTFDPTRPWHAAVWLGLGYRAQTFLTGAATFLADPLFGSGPGTLPALVDGEPRDAHFTLVNVAATLGAPALLAFLAIPLLLARQRCGGRALWAGVVGLGLEALSDDVEDFRHLWVLFGLIAATPPDPETGLAQPPRSAL